MIPFKLKNNKSWLNKKKKNQYNLNIYKKKIDKLKSIKIIFKKFITASIFKLKKPYQEELFSEQNINKKYFIFIKFFRKPYKNYLLSLYLNLFLQKKKKLFYIEPEIDEANEINENNSVITVSESSLPENQNNNLESVNDIFLNKKEKFKIKKTFRSKIRRKSRRKIKKFWWFHSKVKKNNIKNLIKNYFK